MYRLQDLLAGVKGIGPTLLAQLQAEQITTVLDLLLFLPLRYEDRSKRVTISQLQLDELVTLEAEVVTASQFYRNRRSIQTAQVKDETGTLKLMWFNNKFVLGRLKAGKRFLFSGKLGDRGVMVQPVIEEVGEDTLHTGRLVPVYSAKPGIKIGTLRRLQKEVTARLAVVEPDLVSTATHYPHLNQTFAQLHFPDQPQEVIKARERLAVEELLSLIDHSHQMKSRWEAAKSSHAIATHEPAIPPTIPFTLTNAQERAIADVLTKLAQPHPMNQLLIGDVGAGKTIVAGVAAWQTTLAGQAAALVAPTQILAEQHAQTLAKLFPDMPLELVMGKNSKTTIQSARPGTLYVGTHAVVNRLAQLQPALVIFDEQHRFGVSQRTLDTFTDGHYPHCLTMTATPIPRSLMLTIFAHLGVTILDELPPGRIPTKTWVTPESKRDSAYDWLAEHTTPQELTIVVCPFIAASKTPGFEEIANVTDMYSRLQKRFPQHRVAALHSQLSASEKDRVVADVFAQRVAILVTTPIVEVGLDLPQAQTIVIEAAERFGLASLHQLRGRVGRAGQQGYCLLFTTPGSKSASKRLQYFAQENSGMKVAEFDLQNRGAGDLFGSQQHGFESLRFAEWTNLEVVAKARQTYDLVVNQPEWRPLFNYDQTQLEVGNN